MSHSSIRSRLFILLLLVLGGALVAKADSTGTGFFVSGDGYLVTNHHVIKGSKKFLVKQGQKAYEAKVVAFEAENDLAILKVAPGATPFPFLAVQGTVDPTPGSDAFTIGFPDPEDLGLTPKTTKGSITALAGLQDDPRHYQISVQIQPGNSVGPLIDEAGHVVVVTTSIINAMRQ
ncbi:serine protease [Verrucomicrobiales bacterium]|nr:serine protease [Verrucomicrobiales bacterium]